MLIIYNAWADKADTSWGNHYNLETDEIIADQDAWSDSNSTGKHFRQWVRECSRPGANHEEEQDFSWKMSPVILLIVCISWEKIMQCGCAAALKGMAAWKGSIFGSNRKAARNKTRKGSKGCKFRFRRQPNCNCVFRRIYWVFVENLPKWRSVAVARSPSLWERCACWVYAQPWVRSLLLTSRSKSRRLWMQRSIK